MVLHSVPVNELSAWVFMTAPKKGLELVQSKTNLVSVTDS